MYLRRLNKGNPGDIGSSADYLKSCVIGTVMYGEWRDIRLLYVDMNVKWCPVVRFVLNDIQLRRSAISSGSGIKDLSSL